MYARVLLPGLAVGKAQAQFVEDSLLLLDGVHENKCGTVYMLGDFCS